MADPTHSHEFWEMKTIDEIYTELAARGIPRPMARGNKEYTVKGYLIKAALKAVGSPAYRQRRKLEGVRKAKNGKPACNHKNAAGEFDCVKPVMWGVDIDPTHCGPHADKNTMKNRVSPQCRKYIDGVRCKKQACCRGPTGEKILCLKCSGGMRTVTRNYCNGRNDEGCGIIACFGVRGSGRKGAKFCKNHKTDDMVDLVNRQCAWPGCEIQPHFGEPGGKPIFCETHADDTMVHVTAMKCKVKGCATWPSYGYKDIRSCKERCCFEHKNDDMIHLSITQCEGKNGSACTKQAHYAFKGEKARRCGTCKEYNMRMIAKQCAADPECMGQARYGVPCRTATHCYTHRERTMIVCPRTRCEQFSICRKWATHGTAADGLMHCERHTIEGESDMATKTCTECGLTCIPNANGKCNCCDPRAFAAGRLAKQNALMAYLDQRGLKGNSTDRIILDGCDKDRPDRVFDMERLIVVLECDENQHKDRTPQCEITRMQNIAQTGFGGTPVAFIRWNPDDYKADGDEEPLRDRYETVGNLIDNIGNFVKTDMIFEHAPPYALACMFKMYFDGWEGMNTQKWEIITPFVNQPAT